MPLVVVCGLPSSGKSAVSATLAQFLRGKEKTAIVVSENDFYDGQTRDEIFSDSRKEKPLRSKVKSEALRSLDASDVVVIIDALNYIKGYRYELYCTSKAAKTTQCTVFCDVSPRDAKNWNQSYSEDVFDGLVRRFEAPNDANRWDRPLFLALKERPLDCEAVFAALFNTTAPKPNRSTQNAPLQSIGGLEEAASAVIGSILDAQKSGLNNVRISADVFVRLPNKKVSMAELTRLKRRFAALRKIQADAADRDEEAKNVFAKFVDATLNGELEKEID